MYYGGSLIGLLVLIFDILMIIDCVKSSKDSLTKLVWILVILFFPLVGAIIYYLVGRGGK